MKKCVVSFADSGQGGMYQLKLKRLEASLKGNFDGDFLGFTDYKEIGCEPHSVIPYKFKPYAIQKAVNLGYELVLWCDSPIVAVKNIQPVFDHIERFGYLFFDNIGHPLGRWCNQKTLDHFFFSRDQAMQTKMIMACVMGFDFRVPAVINLFEEYKGYSPLYPGSWDNHRHDQTIMSILLDLGGFDILPAHETFFIYEEFKKVKEFNISENVCLVSK